MLKYAETMVTFREIPSEVTLCINITGCPIHCEGCHSKHLWEDTGTPLNKKELDMLIKTNEGITAICLMGGDNHPIEVFEIAEYIKKTTSLKVGWYSGKSFLKDTPLEYFDYIKTGPYKKDLGGLDSVTTNQRFYEVHEKCDTHNKLLYRYLEDVTWKFQKKKDEIGNNTNEKRGIQ